MYGKHASYLVPLPALCRARVVEADINHAVVLGDHARGAHHDLATLDVRVNFSAHAHHGDVGGRRDTLILAVAVPANELTLSALGAAQTPLASGSAGGALHAALMAVLAGQAVIGQERRAFGTVGNWLDPEPSQARGSHVQLEDHASGGLERA